MVCKKLGLPSYQSTTITIITQESIPVGCVPPARHHSVVPIRGVSPRQRPPRRNICRHRPPRRNMGSDIILRTLSPCGPVKTLPCPKLHLFMVIKGQDGFALSKCYPNMFKNTIRTANNADNAQKFSFLRTFFGNFYPNCFYIIYTVINYATDVNREIISTPFSHAN